MWRHTSLPRPPATNCHTFLYHLPIEREILSGRPKLLDYNWRSYAYNLLIIRDSKILYINSVLENYIFYITIIIGGDLVLGLDG